MRTFSGARAILRGLRPPLYTSLGREHARTRLRSVAAPTVAMRPPPARWAVPTVAAAATFQQLPLVRPSSRPEPAARTCAHSMHRHDDSVVRWAACAPEDQVREPLQPPRQAASRVGSAAPPQDQSATRERREGPGYVRTMWAILLTRVTRTAARLLNHPVARASGSRADGLDALPRSLAQRCG